METDNKIFIIMPFSKTNEEHTDQYWTNHYEHVLKPNLQTISRLPVERSKAIRTDILRDIIKNLIFSKIVLADITDLNANVMWELGVRQSFAKGTIVIAQVGTIIPFDLSIKSVIPYPKLTSNPNYHSDLKKFFDDLKIAINDCISHPEVNDSHVLETISGRGTIYEIIFQEEIIRKLDGLIQEYESNLSYLSDISETIEANELKPKGTEHKWATIRLRVNCIELLLANRYLSQDVRFYSRIQNGLDYILMCNSILDMWPSDREHAESWFKRNPDLIENTLKENLGELREIRGEMIKLR
jgi:hypothetical protein